MRCREKKGVIRIREVCRQEVYLRILLSLFLDFRCPLALQCQILNINFSDIGQMSYLEERSERLREDYLHVFEKTSVKLSLHNQSGL